jgi:hypothetical protein
MKSSKATGPSRKVFAVAALSVLLVSAFVLFQEIGKDRVKPPDATDSSPLVDSGITVSPSEASLAKEQRAPANSKLEGVPCVEPEEQPSFAKSKVNPPPPPDSPAVVRQETLATWVTQITADPERSEDATGNASASHGLGLMNEFFHHATAHLGSHPFETAPARKTIRERLWVNFLNRFKPAQTKTPSGPAAAAFAPWRNRASELSGRYSGLYRGTYFLNHLLAVTAVLLAAWSLVLMGNTSTQLTEWVQSAAGIAHIAQSATDPAKKSSDFAPLVFPVLLALAALKPPARRPYFTPRKLPNVCGFELGPKHVHGHCANKKPVDYGASGAVRGDKLAVALLGSAGNSVGAYGH